MESYKRISISHSKEIDSLVEKQSVLYLSRLPQCDKKALEINFAGVAFGRFINTSWAEAHANLSSSFIQELRDYHTFAVNVQEMYVQRLRAGVYSGWLHRGDARQIANQRVKSNE